MEMTKPYALMYFTDQPMNVVGIKNVIAVHSAQAYAATIEELGIPRLLLMSKDICHKKQQWLEPIQTALRPKRYGKTIKHPMFPYCFSFKFFGNADLDVSETQQEFITLINSVGTETHAH